MYSIYILYIEKAKMDGLGFYSFCIRLQLAPRCSALLRVPPTFPRHCLHQRSTPCCPVPPAFRALHGCCSAGTRYLALSISHGLNHPFIGRFSMKSTVQLLGYPHLWKFLFCCWIHFFQLILDLGWFSPMSKRRLARMEGFIWLHVMLGRP